VQRDGGQQYRAGCRPFCRSDIHVSMVSKID
jgi:hypothetical protein